MTTVPGGDGDDVDVEDLLAAELEQKKKLMLDEQSAFVDHKQKIMRSPRDARRGSPNKARQ